MMLSAARQRVGQVSYRLLRYLSTMRASKEAEEKATNWTLKHEPSIQTQFSSFRLALVSQASILAEGGDTRQVSIAAAYDKPERPVRKMAATAVLSGLSCLDMHCTNAVHKNLHFQVCFFSLKIWLNFLNRRPIADMQQRDTERMQCPRHEEKSVFPRGTQ